MNPLNQNNKLIECDSRWVCFWAMLLCCNMLWANDYMRTEYSYRRYTTQDGLPNMLLETLHQDYRDFIWIGTYKGFARFDGFVFTPFLSETAVNILHFESFPNGDVKAYTYQDVFIVHPNDSMRKVKLVPDSLYLNTFNSRILPSGYLIFENHDATRKYLVRTENDSIRELLCIPELCQIGDNKPFMDIQNGKFYLPSDEHMVYIFDMRTHKTELLRGLHAGSFLKHSSLGLLAFANDGIYRITGNSYHKIVSIQLSGLIHAIEMKDGSMMIKDFVSVYKFHHDKVEKLVDSQLTKFWDILCDKEENLWVASHDGLYNYFHFDFKNYHFKNDVVKSVLETDNENYLMGSYFGNMYRVSGNDVTKVTYPKKDHQNRAFIFGSLAANGLMYFPRDNGVLISDNHRFWWADLPLDEEYCKVVSYKNEQILALKSNEIYRCDKNGTLLASYAENDLRQEDFHDLIVDAHGQWIVAGAKGLTIVGDSIRLINNANSTPTLSLCLDFQGRVWSASENRLNLLQHDSIITTYRFVNNFIQGIQAINNTHLLVATLHGVYLMDIQTYFDSGKFQSLCFDHHNGMTGLEPMTNSLYMDNSGMIWMATNEFLITFNPDKLIRKNTPPTLHILAYETSKNNVTWEKGTEQINIKLNHQHKNVRFSFIGLKYSAVENVRYQYRLKGFQDEWSPPVAEREVTFNNLPPGHYEFQLKANAGTPTTETAIINQSFVILPAFWQTWWFYTVCIALAIFMAGWLVYRYVSKKNAEQIRSLERQKQLNNLQIQSVRLRSIPHFNANVLAGIEYYIMNFSKEEANHYLAMYASFTNLTLRDVDRSARSLAQEIRYIELYLGLEKMRYGEHFDFSIEVAPGVDTEIMLPNMILHTHCENALKHGLRAKKDKGHLHIMADPLMADEVLIAIEDDGIGRAEAERLQTKGTGQGLAILSQQLTLYNQTNDVKIVQRFIDLTDQHAHACGTRVEIEVPKGFIYN